MAGRRPTPQKKVPTDRMAALPTAGMHGSGAHLKPHGRPVPLLSRRRITGDSLIASGHAATDFIRSRKLGFPPAASLARSAFRLGNHSRFAPVAAASPSQARCQFHRRRGRLHSPPPLPFGTFNSLRIKVFSGNSSPPARLPVPPDLRSLPAAVLSLVPAADHRSRSATSRRLAVLKPLGTSPNMPSKAG